jgi:hypothetical protein
MKTRGTIQQRTPKREVNDAIIRRGWVNGQFPFESRSATRNLAARVWTDRAIRINRFIKMSGGDMAGRGSLKQSSNLAVFSASVHHREWRGQLCLNPRAELPPVAAATTSPHDGIAEVQSHSRGACKSCTPSAAWDADFTIDFGGHPPLQAELPVSRIVPVSASNRPMPIVSPARFDLYLNRVARVLL